MERYERPSLADVLCGLGGAERDVDDALAWARESGVLRLLDALWDADLDPELPPAATFAAAWPAEDDGGG